MNDQQRAELEINLAAAGTDPDLVAAAFATVPDGPRPAGWPRSFNVGTLIGLGITVAVILWRIL
jgi:hypothetical protein